MLCDDRDECDVDGYDEHQLNQIALYETSKGNRRPVDRVIIENKPINNPLYKPPRIPKSAYSWETLKRKVRKRDAGICVECGTTERLEVHHILPVIEDKEYAMDEDNCILLCHECHMEKHHSIT